MDAVIEALPDALIVTDFDGHIVLFNARAEFMFGHHRSDMIGQFVENLIPSSARTQHAAIGTIQIVSVHTKRTMTMGVGMDLNAVHSDGHRVSCRNHARAHGRAEGRFYPGPGSLRAAGHRPWPDGVRDPDPRKSPRTLMRRPLKLRMTETEEYASWLESRRLIIAQLAAMDVSIRDLGARIDRFAEASRERALEMAKETQTEISDLNLRVAMLELRAKLWGGIIGMAGGTLATVIVQLATHVLQK